jgi:large subunit ribosomal protein L9
MSNRIRVILLENIDSLGLAGDIVSVTEGYARNALFPAGQAALADDRQISRANKKKQAVRAEQAQQLATLQKQASSLDGTELTISARMKNEEDIFGAINAVAIAKHLQQQGGFTIPPHDIKLSKKITSVGAYPVTISFGSGSEATIQVVITPEADG